MSSLSSRLATIRENSNKSLKSDLATISTPLSAYIAIYNRSKKEGYANYMQGAKALYSYLSPIDIPDIPIESLPSYIPDIIHRYEVDRLANILAPKESFASIDQWLAERKRVERLIVYYTARDILTNSSI